MINQIETPDGPLPVQHIEDDFYEGVVYLIYNHSTKELISEDGDLIHHIRALLRPCEIEVLRYYGTYTFMHPHHRKILMEIIWCEECDGENYF